MATLKSKIDVEALVDVADERGGLVVGEGHQDGPRHQIGARGRPVNP